MTYPAAFSVNGIGKVYLNEGKLPAGASSTTTRHLDIAKKFDDKLQIVRSLRKALQMFIQSKITRLWPLIIITRQE